MAAPPERCFAVADDIEHYPEWAADIKEVTVHERDDQGRPSLVTFRAAAFGRSTTTPSPTTTPGPPRPGLAADQGRHHHQARRAATSSTPTGDGGTEITYHLEVELRVPIPGFIKMRAQSRIMSTALRELKARVESVGVTAAAGDGAVRSRIGVDIGGTKVLGVAVDATGGCVAEARVPTPQAEEPRRATADGPIGADGADAVAVGRRVAVGGRPGGGDRPRRRSASGRPGMVDRDRRAALRPQPARGGRGRPRRLLPAPAAADAPSWSRTTPTAPPWPSTASAPPRGATTA